MRTLNLGILAHVDAGKTTLTERLLHAAGAIDEIGSVDDGTTRTDTLALERRRGITIKSAVVSFAVGGTTVNLIDTPGHPDFIAEVERALGVLDGAVLVVSGVEGVQAQTRVLFRALRRLGIPLLFFVNKLDRPNADFERARADIAAKLDGVSPVLSGSAMTGDGVGALLAALTERLPAAGGDPGGPVSGTVFKIEGRDAYVRMHSGTLRVRDRLEGRGKVTALEVIGGGEALEAGRIGRVSGLDGVRIGDAIGSRHGAVVDQFAPPTLESVVEPVRPADRGRLHAALEELARQDPLIGLRAGEVVALYGEVQKEVIQATLADEFGVEATFRETTTICVERPAGRGAAFEIIDEGDNPFLATVGLRVEPAGEGAGLVYGIEVELGSMPGAFFRAVEESVEEALQSGLYGWEVLDARVTLTHSGYWPRQSHSHQSFNKSMSSTAGDFRGLTPIVLRGALERAGTRVYEPLHAFRLELPGDTLGAVLPLLARLGGFGHPGGAGVLEGEIPAARVHELRRRLPALTRGEGFLESEFARHAPARGRPPVRL